MTPDRVLHLGLGFWSSKTVLSAVECGVFSELAKAPGSLDDLQARLGLHPRSARDFLDALVALGLLQRHNGIYSNAEEADLYFDPTKLSYIGGLLEMANARLYGLWGSLSDSLRSGEPQDDAQSGPDSFPATFTDPQRLRMFLSGMNGISVEPAKQIAQKFDWTSFKTFMDISSGQGMLSILLARAHRHLNGLVFSPPQVRPQFEELVVRHDLVNRVSFHPGDAFKDSWPNADVIVMGYYLQLWNLAQKQLLLKRAFEALPKGGALIVYNAIIDDERRENLWPLLSSLNMLLQTPEGFEYTGRDCRGWMSEVGFKESRVEHLTGPLSMVIGFK